MYALMEGKKALAVIVVTDEGEGVLLRDMVVFKKSISNNPP